MVVVLAFEIVLVDAVAAVVVAVLGVVLGVVGAGSSTSRCYILLGVKHPGCLVLEWGLTTAMRPSLESSRAPKKMQH